MRLSVLSMQHSIEYQHVLITDEQIYFEIIPRGGTV